MHWILIVVVSLIAFNAWAQVARPSGPFDPVLLATYVWVLVISMLGGMAAFFRKVRDGKARPFNIPEFVGELFISAFAGVVTFWFCSWAGMNEWLTAAFVGISGHMGSRALFVSEGPLERFLGRIFGNGTTPPKV